MGSEVLDFLEVRGFGEGTEESRESVVSESTSWSAMLLVSWASVP